MDIGDWLRGLDLGRYELAFRENEIDEQILPSLTTEDLREIGVGPVGHRRKLLEAIAALSSDKPGSPVQEPFPAAAPDTNSSAERRQLTVMFCDLVGSTELATRHDPEDLRAIIAAYHGAVAEEMARFGGFVAKFMGDGVLAYFGYPKANEEDAERAVRAALEVVAAVKRLDLPEKLAVRIGIATGLVVVGDLIGAGPAQEQSVVGETPNLAARLQGLAEPNAIVVADSTLRHIGSLFEVRDLGPQSLKGFVGAPRAWQVLGESGIASRFEALRSRETPLVGREEELELLLRRWNQAKSGEGRVVLLSAESGIGKSRLVEAVTEKITAEPHRRLRYFCSPHHQGSALHPIIGQLERAAGFARDDDSAARCRKLAEMMSTSGMAPEDLPLLADLLAVPLGEGQAAVEMTPQQRKDRVFAMLLQGLESLARHSPVLMVFEDLHWMDPTSRELLDRVITGVERLPILLIATFRPEFQPPWVGQAQVTALALPRLSRRDGAALVQRLAGNSAGLTEDVIEEIVERTDGVPLFLEEVTKVVLEAETTTAKGAIAAIPGARMAVPATLQASLMARLDRLGPAARDIAQTGAAIGREFSYDLLIATSSHGAARAALDQLVAAGLLFQRGEPPTSEYQFKHALVQDTAYATLLRGARQALHARIAAAVEAHRPELVERQPEILAYHLAEAGLVDRAAVFWRKAGEQAVRRAANREAIGHFRRVLSLVEAQVPGVERGRAELGILSQLASPTMALFGWSAAEVGDVVERAAAIGRQLPSSAEMAPAIANLWIFYQAQGELERAAGISDDLFRIARETGDTDVLLQAHHTGWATRFFQGRFAEADHHIAAGEALYDKERHAHHRHVYLGHDAGACGMNFAASVQAALGFLDRSYRFALDGIELARALDHPLSMSNALWRACEAFVMRGDVGAVYITAEEMVQLSETRGLPLQRAWALGFLGWAEAHSGDPAKGIPRIEEGENILGGIQARLHTTLSLSLHAESLLVVGEYAHGLKTVDAALRICSETGEQAYAAHLYRVRARALRHLGDAEAAVEQSLRKGIELARHQGAKGRQIGGATDLARLWVDQEKREEARELLAPVYDWFTEGFDTPDLKEAKALLDSLA